jgi:hypothetical protein
MNAQEKYVEWMKARALAGMLLVEGVDAMVSVMPESPAKDEVIRMIAVYYKAVKEAREIREAI